MKAQELVEKSLNLLKEIEEYITSVPNWIYYWLPPTLDAESKNRSLKEFVVEMGDEWEAWVSLKVVSFNGVSVKVEIYLDDNDNTRYERYLVLQQFERNVIFNKKAMDGELNEMRIQELNTDIAFHKEQIKLAEEELEKLTKNGDKKH